jgi:hypothetical protein
MNRRLTTNPRLELSSWRNSTGEQEQPKVGGELREPVRDFEHLGSHLTHGPFICGDGRESRLIVILDIPCRPI